VRGVAIPFIGDGGVHWLKPGRDPWSPGERKENAKMSFVSGERLLHRTKDRRGQRWHGMAASIYMRAATAMDGVG
jgi:hypothetical protein